MFVALGVAECFSVVCLKFLTSLRLVDIGLKFADVEINWKGFCSGKGCSGKEVDCKLHQGPEHPPAVTLGHPWAEEQSSWQCGDWKQAVENPTESQKDDDFCELRCFRGWGCLPWGHFYRKQLQAAGLGLARQSWATHNSELTLCWTTWVKSALCGGLCHSSFELQAGDMGLCNRDESGK